MSYKILNINQNEQTIVTTVEYTLSDNSVKVIEVSHFAPSSKADVLEGISNRELSENAALGRVENNKLIIAALNADVGKIEN